MTNKKKHPLSHMDKTPIQRVFEETMEIQNNPKIKRFITTEDGKRVPVLGETPLKPVGDIIAEFAPGTGEVLEGLDIIKDVKDGKVGSAVGKAAMTLLPLGIGDYYKRNKLLTTKMPSVKILDDVNRGINDATDYLNSVVRKETDAKNFKLAKRLNLKDFQSPIDLDRVNSRIIPIYQSSKELRDNLAMIYQHPKWIPGNDVIAINLDYPRNIKNAASSVYHEILHRANYGAPNIINHTNSVISDNTKEDQTKFYRFLTDKLLSPDRPKFQLNSAKYLLDPSQGELPVWLKQLGYDIGITPGMPYPGKDAAQIWFKKAESIPGKGAIMNALNLDKPERIWRALNGTYYETGGKLQRLKRR